MDFRLDHKKLNRENTRELLERCDRLMDPVKAERKRKKREAIGDVEASGNGEVEDKVKEENEILVNETLFPKYSLDWLEKMAQSVLHKWHNIY